MLPCTLALRLQRWRRHRFAAEEVQRLYATDLGVPRLVFLRAGSGPPGYQGSQFRFGPRVPCLIVSPYAKKEINHTFYSHASVVKFCIRLFGLTAWNTSALAKGDPAGDLFEAFDFAAPPRLALPSVIPK